MRRIAVILIFIVSSATIWAQTGKNFAWYDQQTYALYLQKDWNTLIKLGKEAINNGFDFYYLRMRLGIAHYEMGEYRLAIPHFKQALTFYSNDPLASEYLYYAYKFSGRPMDAGLVYAKYKQQLSGNEVDSPYGIITGFYTEGGLKLLSPANDNVSPLKYFHVGAQQQLGSRLSLYHGYMRISQNVYSYETVNNPGPGPPNTVKITDKYIQNEYYLKAVVPIVDGLQLLGSLHTQAIADIDSGQYNNLAFMGGITASVGLFDFSATYGRARMKAVIQQQVSLGILIYPLKIQNFYLQSVFTHHRDGGLGKVIFFQKAGLRTGTNVWLEAYGSFGDMRNVQDMDGFYQYNTVNPLNMRLGLTGIFYSGARIKLLLGYTFESFEEFDTLLPYQQHYVFAGLQFLIKK